MGAHRVDFISKLAAFTFRSSTAGDWSLSAVGSGTDGTWSTTPVPEPQGWALMSAGLVAAGAVALRRRRA